MCRSPERLESCARSDEPGLGRATSSHAPSRAELEQDSSEVEHLRRDNEYGHSSKAGEDLVPLAVAELRVDSVKEVDVGREGFVTAQVVVANDNFRERLDKALYGPLSIVGDHERALWMKVVQPPLERGSAYAIGRDNVRASCLEPRVDCARSAGYVRSSFGRSDKLFACGWNGEDSGCLRPEPVPGFRTHEIVPDDGPFRPEVVVMTKRDSYQRKCATSGAQSNARST